MGALAGLPAGPAAAEAAADPVAHDPTVIKQGRFYYSFITGDIATRTYLPMRRSADLVHWSDLGVVFSAPPQWVVEQLGNAPGDFWAPDISYFDGEYHLYYAASTFGTNNSVIGLATNKTLDPGSPAYHWTDRGMVFRSGAGDNFNAIDPDLVFDRAGQPWLSFGSFWDGIKMRRLDRRTGMLSTADTTLHSLASRGGASIEGPSIVRHGGYYYLFASLDFCCRGIESDYRVVVGRSVSVTGPYLDRDGVPMLNGGGTELLRGYHKFRGPGGGDVLGDLYVHHYYDLGDNGLPKLSVRPISWPAGWPSLGDPLSGNDGPGRGPAYVTLVNRADGRVVANPSCGYEGAGITLENPSGGTCEQWRPEDRGDGYVSLGNRFSNKVAEVAACVNADGARVAQWGWLANDCQRFRFVPAVGGWVTVESKLSGRVLTGSPVQTWPRTGAAAEQFRLQPVGDVLLVGPGGRPGRWHFEHVADGYYRVVQHGWALPGQWRIAPGAGLVDRAGHTLDVRLETPR